MAINTHKNRPCGYIFLLRFWAFYVRFRCALKISQMPNWGLQSSSLQSWLWVSLFCSFCVLCAFFPLPLYFTLFVFFCSPFGLFLALELNKSFPNALINYSRNKEKNESEIVREREREGEEGKLRNTHNFSLAVEESSRHSLIICALSFAHKLKINKF